MIIDKRCLLLLLICFACMWNAKAENTEEIWPHVTCGQDISEQMLQRMFRAAEEYSDTVKAYRADLYLKGRLHLYRQNRIIRYVPSMFRFEKGVKDYIYESLSELHYTAPRIYDRKVRAVSGTFPASGGEIFDVLDFLRFNIYAPSLMGDKVLSPLSRRSRIHYRYRLDSIDYSGDEYVMKVRVIPRYHSTQLLEGFFWISAKDWIIRALDFKGKYDLLDFHVVMQMGDTTCTQWLPKYLKLDLDFRFLYNHIAMNYTGWMKYNDVKLESVNGFDSHSVARPSGRYNLSESYVLSTDTTQLISDRDSFACIRPLPLTDVEDSLYAAFDRRHKEDRQDSLVTTTRIKRNLVYMGQIGDALISSYNIDLSKVGNIRCSPLINPLLVGYSHRNGISYRQEFKYNKLFHNGRLLHIVPQIGYNFTRKELYAKMDAEFVYLPKRHGAVTMSVGNGNRIYSSIVQDQLKAMSDTLFSFDRLELDYFKDVYLNLSHNIEIINGLTLWTGVAMHWRNAVHATPEIGDKVRVRYNSFAPRLRVEWTPGMFYYMNGYRKINVGSYYPTFIFDYERGVKVNKNAGEYERFEFSAEQKIRVRQVHTIAYHVGGGFFTNQKDLYFVDYVNFANRNLPQGWNDDIGGTFQMLDARWYNASRHYFRGNMTYETPFLLLYPVSRLLSFIQKERIYAGILFMPHLNPYIELGYGIGTHLFDFGIFTGNERGKFTSVGCKFTFELFNK